MNALGLKYSGFLNRWDQTNPAWGSVSFNASLLNPATNR
jgi:hypothetical protein